jgi:hypothetical protein
MAPSPIAERGDASVDSALWRDTPDTSLACPPRAVGNLAPSVHHAP